MDYVESLVPELGITRQLPEESGECHGGCEAEQFNWRYLSAPLRVTDLETLLIIWLNLDPMDLFKKGFY